VLPGATIVVAPGQKVPLDGIIVAGTSDVNQAPITGESLPVPRGAGDEVFAGTINGQGALDVRVTRAVRDTTLARIVHLVEAAQAQRAPAQQFIDRFARWYTPAVVLAALALFLVPVAAGGSAAAWGYRALVLLVVACPCALVISTPVTVVAAVTALATRGIVVKGGAPLERAAATSHYTRDAFDAVGVRIASDDDDAATLQAADVVLMAGAPDAETLRLFGRQAAYAVAVIRQNVGISLVTKLVFLVSALLGSAPLWLAVVADTGATVAVTLNGLRLLRLRR
jgi:Cd2+/Zn2+-exporting ATPase